MLAGQAPLAWLPADHLVALLLELLLLPPPALGCTRGSGGASASAGTQTVLGWAAVTPFSGRPGSCELSVAQGLYQVGG